MAYKKRKKTATKRTVSKPLTASEYKKLSTASKNALKRSIASKRKKKKRY